MNKHLLSFIAFLLYFTASAAQDSFTVRAQRYIDQYNSLAVAEQRRAGIPASVTLAQGVLETEAGKSELVCMANNHFGIKCKNDYTGEKFLHDDDAPKECFKMYRCAEDSYRDHSDYLKRNPRYSPLFALSQTDYASWAVGLKRCGYATNPQYAQRLIKIIEDFKLQEYTYSALDSSSTQIYSAAFAADTSKQDTINNMARMADIAIKEKGDIVVAPSIARPLLSAVPDTVKIADTVKKAMAVDTVKKAMATDTLKKEMAIENVKPAPSMGGKESVGLADTSIVAPVATKHDDKSAVPAPAPMVAKEDTVKAMQPKAVMEDTQFDSGKIVVVNGLKAFYANKGELLLQYAVKYNMRYSHLLEINDLPDAPLPANMVVYLERKLTSGTHQKHIVKDGETLYLVSQDEGMELKRLMALNMLDQGDEPAIGATLELQNGAAHKPNLRTLPAPDLKSTPNLSYIKPTPPDDYVVVRHTKPSDSAQNPVRKDVNRDTYVSTIHVPADTSMPKTETGVAIHNDPPAKVPDSATTSKSLAATPVVPVEPTAIVKPVQVVKQDSAKDDLADLKKELDKVVYADDSKLLPAPVAGKIEEPIKLSTNLGDAHPATKKGKVAKNVKEQQSGKYYTVKKGDTLGAIAKRNNVTVKQIERLNHVKEHGLQLGQKLRLK